MSGNYRITTFQAALLNAQMDRLTEQVELRQHNAAYLTKRLSQVPGIRPQARYADETRKVYHLYLFRYDAEQWGASRDRFEEAMRAEGVPAGAGYPLSLFHQPLFAERNFGPFTACLQTRPGLNYKAWSGCPVCERACATEGMWIYHSVLLGTEGDMDDVASAFEKVYENRGELQ
jgi:dTDP-4-amino-4,6-dideoxygalactose transaminase